MEIILLVVGLVVGFFAGKRVEASKAHVPSSGEPLAAALRDLSSVGESERALVEALQEPPKVSPETVPMEVTSAQLKEIAGAASTGEDATQVARRFVGDPDVAELLVVLSSWRMSRKGDSERDYEESFMNKLKNSGLLSRIERQRRLPLLGLESTEDRVVIPDVIFKSRVLCELKGDLNGSADVDRAVGQMLRYLLAWKAYGPAVLVICGDLPPVLKFIVLHYVNAWRTELNLPVTVLFKRGDGQVPEQGLMPAGERRA